MSARDEVAHELVGGEDHRRRVVARMDADPRGTAQGLPVLLLVAAKGGNIPTQLLLDDRVFAVTAVYTEFADPSKVDYSWNRSLPNSQQAFASGELALYVGYASEEPTIAALNPNLNFAAAPLPQVRGAARTLDTAHVYAFAVARTSVNPSGAITAAYMLASAANSQAFSTALGIPSARRDVLSQPAQGDQDLFNKMAITSHSWVDPDPVATAALFQSMIEDTTSGAVLLTDAVQRADQQMGHILGL